MVLKKFEVSEEAQIVGKRDVGGFSLIEAWFPAGLHVPHHGHEKACFGSILRGACTEVYIGKTREYKPLSLEFLPPHHTHSVTYGIRPTLTFGVHIPNAVLTELIDQSLFQNVARYFYRDGPLSLLVARLYEEFKRDDPLAPLAIEGLVFEMLAVSLRKNADLSSGTKPPAWLEQAREILHAHFLDNLSVQTIAQIVGVHAVHLCREFRRHYSSTLGAYVRQLRIEYACQEILKTNKSFAEIAVASGFSDQSHFSRTFKRIAGVTPASFRAGLAKQRLRLDIGSRVLQDAD